MTPRKLIASLVVAGLAGGSLPGAARAADPPVASGTPLHLVDAVKIATSTTPTVQLAVLREREARAREGQARGLLFPALGGAASDVNRTFSLAAQGITIPGFPDLIGPVESFDARFRVTETLLDLSSYQRVRAADLGTRQAIADRGAAADGAAQSAALAYLRAARAQATVFAREADARIAQDLLTLAEAQQSAGTAPSIDATRARTPVATSRGQLVLAHNQLDRALMDLARALGVDPATRLDLADTLGSDLARSDAPEEESTAVGVALERRGELASERARQGKARAERSAISAERLPRVDASADWGLSGMHAHDAVTTRTLAVGVSVPLFDGLRRESRIAEQSAVVRESEVREKDLRDQIASDVRGALIDLASGREQQGIAAERLALAEEELAQARERFVNGVAGNIEVIDAQSSMVRARDADIDARFAIATARVALARATGLAGTLR